METPMKVLIGLGVVLISLIGLAIYFIPSLVARARGKRNRRAIYALNLLAGWTIGGWIGALVWALTAEPPPTRTDLPQAVPSANGSVALKPGAAPSVPEPGSDAGAPTNGALSCQVCGRVASSFCTVHGVPLCEAHLNAHDTPQCSYVPSGRVQVVSAVPAPSERKHASSCQVCGRAASSFCTVHGLSVCEAHLNAHDTPQCSYVPSGRVQVVSAAPAGSERRPATSILGLG